MSLMKTYKRFPKKIVSGEGNYLIDEDGKKYLDFLSGIAVNLFGYNDKTINEAIVEQVEKIIHASNLFSIDSQEDIGDLLVENTIFDEVFLANSGTEANEGALKLARKYSFDKYGEGRHGIVSFKNSFHGRTLMSLKATGQSSMHKYFGPFPEGFTYGDFNDEKALVNLLDDNCAAVIVEIIQGEGGVVEVEESFIRKLEKICKEKDILLIVDEIQCGFMRTGKLFAYEHFSIEPDIVTIAKAFGGGLPLGGIMAKREVSTHFAPGDHGSTFGGNPVAANVAAKVLKKLIDEDYESQVQKKGEYLKNSLMELSKNFDFISDVRGKGLMIGVEFKEEVQELASEGFTSGFILNVTKGNVLRLVPPLNISECEIDKLMEFLNSWLNRRKNG